MLAHADVHRNSGRHMLKGSNFTYGNSRKKLLETLKRGA
jgi:hypothetical protein